MDLFYSGIARDPWRAVTEIEERRKRKGRCGEGKKRKEKAEAARVLLLSRDGGPNPLLAARMIFRVLGVSITGRAQMNVLQKEGR
jgi:hypothetical protein